MRHQGEDDLEGLLTVVDLNRLATLQQETLVEVAQPDAMLLHLVEQGMLRVGDAQLIPLGHQGDAHRMAIADLVVSTDILHQGQQGECGKAKFQRLRSNLPLEGEAFTIFDGQHELILIQEGQLLPEGHPLLLLAVQDVAEEGGEVVEISQRPLLLLSGDQSSQ